MSLHDNHSSMPEFNARLLQEFYDSYDEELEMELDDLRLDKQTPETVDEKTGAVVTSASCCICRANWLNYRTG